MNEEFNFGLASKLTSLILIFLIDNLEIDFFTFFEILDFFNYLIITL